MYVLLFGLQQIGMVITRTGGVRPHGCGTVVQKNSHGAVSSCRMRAKHKTGRHATMPACRATPARGRHGAARANKSGAGKCYCGISKGGSCVGLKSCGSASLRSGKFTSFSSMYWDLLDHLLHRKERTGPLLVYTVVAASS